MDNRLEILTLGGVRILRAGEPVEGLNNRKSQALLIYLASTRRPLPREVLADLLWDERTQSQSLANLRVVLTALRQSLGEYLAIGRDAVAINPAATVGLDAVRVEEGLRELHQQGKLNDRTAGQAAEVLALYRGDFLEGFSVTDCRQFEEWQMRERERLHRLAVDGLSELVAYDIEQQKYQLGMVHAAQLLELDPLMEDAHRQMMFLLANCGQRAAALAQYETCRKLLKDELGVAPAEETHFLYEQIRSGSVSGGETGGDNGAREMNPPGLSQPEKPGTGAEPTSLLSGTVTFLFTDIEGSTRLLERLRDQYAEVLGEQRELLREIFQRWHGREVDTQGDSFFVAFGRASDAISCSMEAQQCLYEHAWPQGVSVRVRMGLHTGEPLVAKTGYVGMDVHRAARIAAVGHGGQVLLSQTTRDLVALTLPPGTRLRDLGAHLLKDIRYPQEIYQLEIPGQPSEFPPLKSLDKLAKEEEPPAPGQSPYMGLQYFDEGDAEWFFGRQAVTSRLLDAAGSQHFLAVIGASGSGKSSVVRAGLVPAIKTRYPHWQVKVITPSSHPLEALAINLTRESESVTATATLMDDMQCNLRSLHLFCQKNLITSKDTRLLLVIDQFEELFTSCRSEEERLAFVTNLLYAACVPDGRVTTVITLRADFYDRLAQYVGLRELVAAHQVYIGAMNASELRSAIEEPARRGGWEFSPGLVDLILTDLGVGERREPEPGALPLLSHALLETWKRRRGNLMNLKAYTEAGGVRGAIARTAESVFYGELTPDQQEIAKSIFLRLTELGEGAQDTRRRISLRELAPQDPARAEQIQAVLVKLADARLIITGEDTAEVAHEALIREWPALREWLAADREGLRLHRHLTETAQEWELLERDPGSLLRGTRLSQAVDWVMTNPRALNAQEQAFLDASCAAAENEQLEREAQRQRELEAAQKLAEERGRSAKRLRRRAWLLGGVLVLALALAGMAGIFGQQADTNAKLANQNLATAEGERQHAEGEAQLRATAEAAAQDAAHLATSRYLTTAALNNLMLNSQLSAHLALLAYQAYATKETESALHLVLPELRLLNSTLVTDSIAGFPWLLRDGKLLIVSTAKGIRVDDKATGVQSILPATEKCEGISPTQGRWLWAACPWGNFEVWDIDTQQLLFTVPDIGLEVIDSDLIPPSPTQPLLAWVSYSDMTIHVWEVPSGKELFVLGGHSPVHSRLMNYQFLSLRTSQDGKRLATFGSDGLVILWDRETGGKLLQFDARSTSIDAAAFSPDGIHLATWGEDKTIKIWDLTSLSPEPLLKNIILYDVPNNFYFFFLYSPDGSRLAVGGVDGVRVWSADTGELQLILTGQKGGSYVQSFSSDGNRLYTFSNDQTIKEWDLTLSHERLTLPGRIGNASFSPDGKQLALGKADGTLSIVDSKTGEVLQTWQAHKGSIEDIAWSPDGKRLATTNGLTWYSTLGDATTKIWDASTGKLLKEIREDKADGFSRTIWSPDGSRLVTARWQTGVALIWDTSSWNQLITLKSPDGFFAVAYSPDGKEIAASASKDLFVWDAATGNQVFTYRTSHTANGLAFSPGGQQLAASQTDGSILLFKSLDNGAEPSSFSGGDQMVGEVAFSPDGALLASGDAAGTVRVWDLKTMLIRLEMETFSGDKVSRVAFGPDGRLVASSAGGLTYFYVLPPDELIQLVGDRIKLPMEPAECLKYLGSETCPPWP
jgi:WD40 repeat protein/class 3 adenylate cyclase/DNA-binding SARP family transcriptional activator